MKIIIMILFLFAILLFFASIEIDIKKIELVKKKIKFKIYIRIYILGKIKIYQRKISKKDILRIIDIAQKRKIKRIEKKIIKKEDIKFEKINFKFLFIPKNQYIHIDTKVKLNFGKSIVKNILKKF